MTAIATPSIICRDHWNNNMALSEAANEHDDNTQSSKDLKESEEKGEDSSKRDSAPQQPIRRQRSSSRESAPEDAKEIKQRSRSTSLGRRRRSTSRGRSKTTKLRDETSKPSLSSKIHATTNNNKSRKRSCSLDSAYQRYKGIEELELSCSSSHVLGKAPEKKRHSPSRRSSHRRSSISQSQHKSCRESRTDRGQSRSRRAARSKSKSRRSGRSKSRSRRAGRSKSRSKRAATTTTARTKSRSRSRTKRSTRSKHTRSRIGLSMKRRNSNDEGHHTESLQVEPQTSGNLPRQSKEKTIADSDLRPLLKNVSNHDLNRIMDALMTQDNSNDNAKKNKKKPINRRASFAETGLSPTETDPNNSILMTSQPRRFSMVAPCDAKASQRSLPRFDSVKDMVSLASKNLVSQAPIQGTDTSTESGAKAGGGSASRRQLRRSVTWDGSEDPQPTIKPRSTRRANKVSSTTKEDDETKTTRDSADSNESTPRHALINALVANRESSAIGGAAGTKKRFSKTSLGISSFASNSDRRSDARKSSSVKQLQTKELSSNRRRSGSVASETTATTVSTSFHSNTTSTISSSTRKLSSSPLTAGDDHKNHRGDRRMKDASSSSILQQALKMKKLQERFRSCKNLQQQNYSKFQQDLVSAMTQPSSGQ